ncbi:MAG: hypothetical protein IPI53_17690 [Saprospiraceae bacterium]|nr:hypothetical protein [Saprospiraceae bacterium]
MIRNQGSPNPDFLSLWLCGLPANGAGANNAKDWTNPDGTWDYTKKPQVEGNVIWDGQFTVTLDGNGNRILKGNGLPNHPTGIFPIQPGTLPYIYDRNPNIISPQPLDKTFRLILRKRRQNRVWDSVLRVIPYRKCYLSRGINTW